MNKVLTISLLTMLFPVLLSAIESSESPDPLDQTDYGIIFNIGSILDGIGSYQGGIGFKYHKNEAYWRFLLDLSYDYDTNFYSSILGVSREYHTSPDKAIISPYYGWGINLGFTYLSEETTDTTLSTVPIAIEALFGAEWLITDYISLFVEYSLKTAYEYTIQESTTLGDEKNHNFNLNTGLGNNGKIGIIIYFPNSALKGNKSE